ncbi:Transcription repressor OFP17 [Cocos nucifera]|uniref:Transcription repressor OFP17 n=1 Tax=Cocos nucifera TaxID=13894 RepID=A0A8K0N0D6_COCNU|nr:Transcription repressor OFP17 [Cocos nucifera]
MLRPSRQSEDIDKVGELRSMTERARAPCPSPITPAYIKMARLRRAGVEEGPNEVEEACRSFENYLVEMIVEERKVRDLMDVEELLYCWNSLKSPVFVELVSRFYGELCKDLFSSRECEVTTDDTCANS